VKTPSVRSVTRIAEGARRSYTTTVPFMLGAIAHWYSMRPAARGTTVQRPLDTIVLDCHTPLLGPAR
jgi:hypothetical protein